MQGIIDRISRWWHSFGFGIQSPWAYSVVTDVICERLPYYDYERIDREYKSRQERRRQKLYLRIRNRFPQCRFYSIVDLSQNGESACDNIPSDEVFLLTDIRESDEAYHRWLRLRDSDVVGVTFDLYDLALCFHEEGRYKQHYRLKY